MADCVCTVKAPGLCPVSFLNNLDVCDLENYKHPPFMFTLWYLCLLGKAIYEKIKEMLDKEGEEGGDDGKGGDKKGKDEDKKDEEEEGGEGGAEEGGDEEGGEEEGEEGEEEG